MSNVFNIFTGLFWAVGFGMLAWGGWGCVRASRALSWPATTAQLEKCELETRSDGEGGDTYIVNVKYSYTVNNHRYSSTKLAIGYAPTDRREQSEIYEKLRNARTVRIRYKPADPSDAVIAPGINKSITATLLFATMWLLFIAGFSAITFVLQRRDGLVNRIEVVNRSPTSMPAGL